MVGKEVFWISMVIRMMIEMMKMIRLWFGNGVLLLVVIGIVSVVVSDIVLWKLV